MHSKCTHAGNQAVILSSLFSSTEGVSKWLTRDTSLRFLLFSTQDQGSAEVEDDSRLKLYSHSFKDYNSAFRFYVLELD